MSLVALLHSSLSDRTRPGFKNEAKQTHNNNKTQNKKIRYTKNKKQEIKSYYQRKSLSLKGRKEGREKHKTTSKQITK